MLRDFLAKPKFKCEYCGELIEDKYTKVHRVSCKEKEKHLQKILDEMGEIPF